MDYFNLTAHYAEYRFKELPPPLEWIEPSINMLYLNAVSSFVLGNHFASIISMSCLLEHTLRLALFDKENTGLRRKVTIEQLDSMGTITRLITEASENGLIDKADLPWWTEVAKVIRHKSAHYIIPHILREFSKKEYPDSEKIREIYHPEYYRFTDGEGRPTNHIGHDWGSFFHKSDYYICRAFVFDATKFIKKIIAKTNWKPDRSWWKSQEDEYNAFFQYKWTYEEMKKSLAKLYSSI
ncbi:MAG: hypothetical protein AB1402_04160 [Bacillota bacterium]